MPEDKKYNYRRHEGTLLREDPETLQFEIYRPKSDSWEEYTYSGAVEQWHMGHTIKPDQVDTLKASLRELEESMNPAPPVYEFDSSAGNRHWGRIWASVQIDSDREVWNVSAGIEGCLSGVIVADGFDDETHAQNYAEDFEAGKICVIEWQPAREWLRMIGLADIAKKFDTDVRERLEAVARKSVTAPDGQVIGRFQIESIYKRGERIPI